MESQAQESGWLIKVISQGKRLHEKKRYHFYLVQFSVHPRYVIMMNHYVPNSVDLKYITNQIIKRNR